MYRIIHRKRNIVENPSSTRAAEPDGISMRRHESGENKGRFCLTPAADDHARGFVRFQSERVIVSGRSYFGR